MAKQPEFLAYKIETTQKRATGSLQSRRFLMKTRRYIDRGCHLEKQQKRLRGRGGGRGEGRGGERRKPALSLMTLNERQVYLCQVYVA